MNTYITLDNYASPLLLLESVDQIPDCLKSNQERVMVQQLVENVDAEDATGRSQAYNAFQSLMGNVTPDYAGAIEKYGAILVNAKGGFFGYREEEEISRFQAESCPNAIC